MQSRFGLLTVLTFVIVLVCTFTRVKAAEISCLETWPKALPATNTKAPELLKRSFPSGFSPLGFCKAAGLAGKIAKGDFETFKKLFQKNFRALELVYLNSPGGDVDEAMAIGRLMRRYLVSAKAPIYSSDGDNYLIGPWLGLDTATTNYVCSGLTCICASACALVWFGSPERSGSAGLHRPVFSDPAFSRLPAADASKVYSQALSRVGAYLREMEAPQNLVESMIATDSSTIRWVEATEDKLTEPPSIAEWINSSCGSFIEDDETTMGQLIIKEKFGGGLTAAEDASRRLLFKRSADRMNCANMLKRRNVDALSAP